MSQTEIFAVQDASQVAVVRRGAARIAELAGLSDQKISAINVTVVELANNLLQHAGGGKIYVRFIASTGALEIAAVDTGPGINNIERCMTDGYSTGSGTPGLGLGAVKRFAKRFDIFSVPNRATIAAARMTENENIFFDHSVICTAIDGETLSGDGWCVSSNGRKFMVVDGLGHGSFASQSARAAIQSFDQVQTDPPGVIIERMHGALRATRGAVAAVAEVDPAQHRIYFAGIGNIAAFLLGEQRSQSFVSHNGTMGHQVRRVQQFDYAYQPGDLLVMQSDGLSTHSKASLPQGLLNQPPSVIAPFLYSETVRGRDDATIMVVRLA